MVAAVSKVIMSVPKAVRPFPETVVTTSIEIDNAVRIWIERLLVYHGWRVKRKLVRDHRRRWRRRRNVILITWVYWLSWASVWLDRWGYEGVALFSNHWIAGRAWVVDRQLIWISCRVALVAITNEWHALPLGLSIVAWFAFFHVYGPIGPKEAHTASTDRLGIYPFATLQRGSGVVGRWFSATYMGRYNQQAELGMRVIMQILKDAREDGQRKA